MSVRLSQRVASINQEQAALRNLDKISLRTGYILEGAELEEYCEKRGLCPLCGQTKVKKKVFRMFKKSTWEKLTVLKKDGSYFVYKGFCVKPTCFTLEQAKRMAGDAVFPAQSKHVMVRQKSWDHIQDEDLEDDSHAEENEDTKYRAAHKPSEGAFPPHDLRQDSSNSGEDTTDKPILVVRKAVEGMLPSSSTIKILELSGLRLRRVDFEALATGLKVSTSLVSFIFENSELDDIDMGIIASGLDAAKDMPLKKLYLRANSIGDAAMDALAPFLQANTTLEKFDVSRNSVTRLGGFAIFAAFAQNGLARIRYLNLAKNKLRKIKDDISGIGPFLERNRSLRILNLEGNGLEDECIEALSVGLQRNERTILERLYLGWNTIGDLGAIGLARMLETNNSIRILGLGENVIQNAGARALLSCLDLNFTLKEISGLWCNMIQRRFFVVAIRKLLLSDDRTKSQPNKEQDQLPLNDINQTCVVDIDVGLRDVKELSEVGSEGDSGLSSLTNDLDAPASIPKQPVRSSSSSIVWTASQSDETQRASPGHEFHYDRLMILQSTPLVLFDRNAAVNRPMRQFDCDRESARIQECLWQSTSGTIDTEVHVATIDGFSAFFQKKSDAHILHLSLTGPSDRIVLENGVGAVQTLSLEDLMRLVFYMNIDLKIVVVSSRHAKYMCSALIDAGVHHIVCCEHDHRYNDPVAFNFLENFYRAAAGRKNLKQAFQIAWSSVASGNHSQSIRHLLNRFQLLPMRTEEDPHHDIPVFFEKSLNPSRPDSHQTRIPLHIPPVPEHFIGREVQMYEVLQAIRAVDVIRVVGPPQVGKGSVVSAACHYAWKRRELLKIDHLLWIPAQNSADDTANTLNDDLNTCAAILCQATTGNIWQTSDVFLDCQKRIETELEGNRCLAVIDLQQFDTPCAQKGLEQLFTFLLNHGAKMLLMESRSVSDGISLFSNISSVSHDTERLEEATIEILPLDFKSSAQLFGEHCPFIANGRCPSAHTAVEFADLLEPKNQPDTTLATRRRSDLFQRIGQGYPEAIRTAAVSMESVEFMELIMTAVRPEVFVDSLVSLDLEVERRTMEQIHAVDDWNFHRAHSLDDLLEDLEILRVEFPDLELLKEEHKSLKEQLDDAVRNRRYDKVNELKRELLRIKRMIMKEQRGSDVSSVATNEKLNALTQKAHAMVLESQSSFKAKWMGNQVTVAVPSGDKRECSFVLSVGSVWESSQSSNAHGGIVIWTNECCHLEGTVMGDPLLRMGSNTDLCREVSALPDVASTPYGSVRCITGNAVVVGPTSYGDFTNTYVILAVGPFSPSQLEDDSEDDVLATPESLAYAICMLRSCYRSTLVLAEHSKLQALTLCLSTPIEGSPHYLTCLRLGLETLVDEVSFSPLRDVYLVAQSDTEAGLLQNMLEEIVTVL